jgi:hypothetical protein
VGDRGQRVNLIKGLVVDLPGEHSLRAQWCGRLPPWTSQQTPNAAQGIQRGTKISGAFGLQEAGS